jgi:hypothetical protein
MRKQMFVLTLVIGLALAVAGFFLAAPIGPTTSPVFSNPRLPFAPTVFTLGVIVLFLSAVIYELFPGGDK